MRTVYGALEVSERPIVLPWSMIKTAQALGTLDGFEFEIKPGYLYVSVRAVSARVNQNYDGLDDEELRIMAPTFVGRPVFVNHENANIKRARGVIKAARYVDTDPKDVHVVVLHELDAITFPKLCAAIASGEIDTTSAGWNISHSVCSVCGHKARYPSEFCQHIQNKGSVFERKTASGGNEMVLAYEICRGGVAFEDSFVFSPADSSAVTRGIMTEAMAVDV